MKLTVLGKYGPFPAAGGACSGYLLECGETALLIELGNGTLSRLLGFKPALDVDAVLLSHLHSDHMADMLVLRYALQQLKSRGIINSPSLLSVVAPASPVTEFRQLAGSGVFDMISPSDGLRFKLNDVSITFYSMLHPVETYAMRIEHDGKSLFYTGDTGYSERLIELCAGCDTLLADTGYLIADKPGTSAAHLTAQEAGLIAASAGIKQLICTHIWGRYSDALVLAEAVSTFPSALIAEELHQYYI